MQALRGIVRDSPSAWRHSNGCELPYQRDFRLVATKATKATLGISPQQNISPYVFGWLVITTHPPPLYFQVSVRGGHGGHGGHAPRIHRGRLSADETAGLVVRVASGEKRFARSFADFPSEDAKADASMV